MHACVRACVRACVGGREVGVCMRPAIHTSRHAPVPYGEPQGGDGKRFKRNLLVGLLGYLQVLHVVCRVCPLCWSTFALRSDARADCSARGILRAHAPQEGECFRKIRQPPSAPPAPTAPAPCAFPLATRLQHPSLTGFRASAHRCCREAQGKRCSTHTPRLLAKGRRTVGKAPRTRRFRPLPLLRISERGALQTPPARLLACSPVRARAHACACGCEKL